MAEIVKLPVGHLGAGADSNSRVCRATCTGNIQSSRPCTIWMGSPRSLSASAISAISGWKVAAIGARWVKAKRPPAGDVTERAAVAHPGQQQPAGIDVPACLHGSENAREVRGVGVFSHQSPGAFVCAAGRVGATRIAPWLRASRSQLHRKPRPLPLPPCSAITSGQARSGV